jgi:hypothetical protein
MKFIISSLLLLSSVLLSAQTGFDLKSAIPQDPKVSKGVLENGMTYYVRSNENPKNRAELFLLLRLVPLMKMTTSRDWRILLSTWLLTVPKTFQSTN